MAMPYSQASSNFSGSVNGGVNPRTGMYTASLLLAHLKANGTSGPFFPISLQYDPSNAVDVGFGIGWGIGWTQYSTGDGVLSLSSGDAYTTKTGSLGLKHQKVVSSQLKQAAGRYYVQNRNGDVFVLGRYVKGDVWLPSRILAPNGLGMDIVWNDDGRLSSIVDSLPSEGGSKQVLLNVDYSGDRETTITLWPDTAREMVITVIMNAGLMHSVTNGDMTWTMYYDSSILSFDRNPPLCGIDYPSGASEQVKYTNDQSGHRFPRCAPQYAMGMTIPYVYQYNKTIVGEEKVRTIDYTFSNEQNYIGFGSDIKSWGNDDNLYSIVFSKFSYDSTETRYDDDGVKVDTKRVYNCFHLLTSEKVTKGANSYETKYSYDLKDGRLFDEQPAYFQLPTEVTVTYTDGTGKSRSETTINKYDDYGNKVWTQAPDGTVQIWEYYPQDGSGDDCPGASLPVDTYLKSEETIPPTVGDTPAPPRRKTIHKYKGIDAGGSDGSIDNPIAYAIVPVRHEEYADDVLQSLVEMEYIEEPGSFHHGRVKTQTTTTVDDTGEQYSNQLDLTYQIADGELTVTSTATGFDGLSTQSSATSCAYSGASLRSVSAQSNEQTCEYDAQGRVTSYTLCANSDYAHTTNYTYASEAVSDDDPTLMRTMVATDPNGIVYKHRYNGENKVVSTLTQMQDVDDWQQLIGRKYDMMGRLKTLTTLDDVATADSRAVRRRIAADAGSTVVEDTRNLLYDDWGQQDRFTLDSGPDIFQCYDPVQAATTERYGEDGVAGQRVTKFNEYYRPKEISMRDPQGEVVSAETPVHDGAGRLVKHTDAVGNTTSFRYDASNRIIEKTYADGTVVGWTYAPHSKALLVESISLNGTALGEQKFDSFGRLVSRTVGGRNYGYEYAGDMFSKPSKVTLPDNTTFTYERITELGEAPKTITAPDGTVRSFTYNPVTGLPVQIKQSAAGGKDDAIVVTLTYTARGQVGTQTINNLAENTSRLITYEYSLGGALLSYTDPRFGKTEFKYDQYGRRSEISDSRSKTVIAYDSDNAVTGWKTTADDHVSNVIIQYDCFKRETTRTIADNKTNLLAVIEYKYDVLSRVTSKMTTINGGSDPLVETFRYDKRSRLTRVTYTGKNRPLDTFGSQIGTIAYDYDVVSNVIAKTISADGGMAYWSFTYSEASDPCRLSKMVFSAPNRAPRTTTTNFSYDAFGRMLNDDRVAFEYDGFGQLSKITQNDGSYITYQYDGSGALQAQKTSGGERREFIYLGGKVVWEIVTQSGRETHIGRTFLGGDYLSQFTDDAAPVLIGTDRNGSVISASQSRSDQLFSYSPYGDRTGQDDQSLPAYNGEIIDKATGYYHLGAGYRTYIPSLMRFNKPDSESPFGVGGINSYAYCGGDPVNNTDPTGHYSLPVHDHISWGGIITSAVVGAVILGITLYSIRGTASSIFAQGLTPAKAGNLGLGIFTAAAFVTSSALQIASEVEAPKDPKKAALLGTIASGAGEVATFAFMMRMPTASSPAEESEQVEKMRLLDGPKDDTSGYVAFDGGRADSTSKTPETFLRDAAVQTGSNGNGGTASSPGNGGDASVPPTPPLPPLPSPPPPTPPRLPLAATEPSLPLPTSNVSSINLRRTDAFIDKNGSAFRIKAILASKIGVIDEEKAIAKFGGAVALRDKNLLAIKKVTFV